VVHIHAPTSIPRKNPMVRSLLRSMTQIFSVFQGFGHQEFVHPTSRTFVCRNPELWFTLPLDPTVKSSPTIYGVDRFRNPCFANSRLANTRVFLFGFSGAETSFGSHVVPPMDSPDEFQDFAYRDFHVLVQLQRVFKPCAHSPDLMVTRVRLPFRTDPKAPTLLVWSPLSLWPYTTPAAVSQHRYTSLACKHVK
jgi:hypothetical protein